jgi:hypothetical protein
MPVKGYIYIVSNPAYRGCIKVGKAQNVHMRLKQLSGATGVLYPFKLEACFKSQDYTADERKAHLTLNAFRIRTNKEFYRMPAEQAIYELTKLFGEPKYSRAIHKAKLQLQQEQEQQNEILRLERIRWAREQRTKTIVAPAKRNLWPWVPFIIAVVGGLLWICLGR